MMQKAQYPADEKDEPEEGRRQEGGFDDHWYSTNMRYLAIFCILCLCAVSLDSQIAPGALHRLIGNPTSVASIPGPDSLSGIAYWWIASDLTVGSTVTQWIDRIQSAVLTQGTAGLRPTVATNGVVFDGTKLLKHDPTFTFNTNYSCWLVLYPSNVSAAYQHVWGTANFNRSINYNTIAKQIKSSWNGAMQGDLGYSVYGDALFLRTNSSGTAGYCWTNGVVASAGSGFDSWVHSNVGSSDSGLGFKGEIVELVIITNNAIDGPTTAALLHRYATNKYGYSP